ncbi:FHA domain-containing protein [Kamptonema cortianum]|nr:FHA domain-containing protein [Geitlerinema splendidum]MDK3156275.1 FHA domain-containing protein [Kamptonema cortianum]
MGRIFARAILCAIAALIAWLVTEPLLPDNPFSEAWNRAELIMVATVLLAIGVAAGLHQGICKGGKRNILVGGLVGGVFGLTAGLFGYTLGGQISVSLFGEGWALQSGFAVIIPRAITFSILALFTGAGMGATQFSVRGVLSGAFGGLVGGGIAGLVFDPIGSMFAPISLLTNAGGESGTIPRAVMWLLISFSLGLFTALFDNLTRQAWLRLELGRNEGKEWPIDAGVTNIGRDERAHVPLFGDPHVLPLHARIVRHGPNYVLEDAGSQIGVGVNGFRIQAPVSLSAGDRIQIAGHQLQFLMKSGAAKRAQEGRTAAVPIGGVSGQQSTPQTMQPIQQPHSGSNPSSSHAGTQEPTIAYQGHTTGSVAPTLVLISGPGTPTRVAVHQPLEIGREGSGLAIPQDQQMSRKHALVQIGTAGLQVQDLGSTNGTYINGQRIQNGVLRPGDTLLVGSSTFKVE